MKLCYKTCLLLCVMLTGKESFAQVDSIARKDLVMPTQIAYSRSINVQERDSIDDDSLTTLIAVSDNYKSRGEKKWTVTPALTGPAIFLLGNYGVGDVNRKNLFFGAVGLSFFFCIKYQTQSKTNLKSVIKANQLARQSH